MNPPRLDEPVAALEPTHIVAPGAACQRGSGERLVAAVRVAGSRRQTTTDLQPLLRRRLLGISVLFLCATVLGVPVAMGSVIPQSGFDWQIAATASPMVLVAAVVSVVLRKFADLTVRTLRALELLLFGVVWLSLIRMESSSASAEHVALHIRQGTLRILAAATAMPWVAPVVAYGVLIPNPWRRCAAAVTLFALTPLALYAYAGWRAGLLDETLLRLFLVELAFWLGLGAVLAIYGAHRIEILRRQAIEARTLGHYRLTRRLGSGGMGEVHQAEHALLRRQCAIKLIHPDRRNPGDLRRFEREVQTTATLTHPNTVQIFDYGHADDGTFYYVMEYLPGLTLDELVTRHGPLPPGRAIHFLRQVCGALREAHAVGLVHRDLKPGNIMVCERGGQLDVAKLLDFGLVQTLGPGDDGERLTRDGAITGTPAYMSPEQVGGNADLDARSDIYSLGCVAHFVLTGRPPFAGGSPVKMLAAHLYEPVPDLSQVRPPVPADLHAVVAACLAKQPDERYSDVGELDQALATCACAGDWDQQQAAVWWRTRSEGTRTDGSAAPRGQMR